MNAALQQLINVNDVELDNALKSFDLGQKASVVGIGGDSGALGLSLFVAPHAASADVTASSKGLQSTLFAATGASGFDGLDVDG